MQVSWNAIIKQLSLSSQENLEEALSNWHGFCPDVTLICLRRSFLSKKRYSPLALWTTTLEPFYFIYQRNVLQPF
jgi:hypothetical protein